MSIPNVTFDETLAKIATCTRVSYCSGEPANYAGIAAVSLGDVTLTAGDGNGDWVIADGDTSGRKVTLLQQAADTPASNGTATYLAFDDGATLLATSPITSQAVTTGQSWIIPQTKVLELRDPTYA